jgi:hypothetical protein
MPNLTHQLQDDKPTRNPGAYVPPHLKRKLAAAVDVPILAEADVSNTPMPAQIASMDSIQDIQGKIILGGCADPQFGSILDPVNIHGPKIRCSKNSKNTVAVGGYGGGDRCSSACPKYQKWEVGAVSECGIRESNEDAFVVAEDLCAANGSVESLAYLLFSMGIVVPTRQDSPPRSFLFMSSTLLVSWKLTHKASMKPNIQCYYNKHCGTLLPRLTMSFVEYLRVTEGTGIAVRLL